MDFVYLVDLNAYIGDDEIKLSDPCVCCLSSRNVLALANDCYIYILPLEKPNELMPVTLSSSPCINMCWSDDGLTLLNVYKNGLCSLFNVKTNLLNTIESAYSFQINSEDQPVVKTFSKSPKLCLNYEKRESSNFSEKFYPKPYNCLKNFGKLAYNGFLFLTKTAVFHVCLLDYNSVKSRFEKFDYNMKILNNGADAANLGDSMALETNAPTIGNGKSFDLVDFSFEADGSIVAAFTNFDLATPIYIYKVNLRLSTDGSSIEGTNELIAQLPVNSELMTTKTKILFTSNESAQHLCVCLRSNQTNLDVIQVWQSSQMSNDLIGSFDLNSMPSEQWTLMKSIQCPSSLIQLCVPKCAVNFRGHNDSRQTNEFLYLLASYQNGTGGFIDLQNFNQTFTSAIPVKSDQVLNQDGYLNEASKKLRFSQEFILALDQSLTGSIGIGLTNFCRLVAFRQPFIKEIGQPKASNNQAQQLGFLQNLYEFCMLGGYDYWDLLINTSPKVVDMLIERLEEQFQSQNNSSLQRVYFSRHHSLMYSLYKRSPTFSAHRSTDVLTKLILNRSLSIISFSTQSVLSMESLASTLASNPATANLVNNSVSPPTVLTSTVSSNSELVSASFNNKIQMKYNIQEFINESIKVDTLKSLLGDSTKPNAAFNLNEIVQSIMSRAASSSTIQVNQQLKHILQWIIDTSLYLISVFIMTPISKTTSTSGQSASTQGPTKHYGASLLSDLGFLNEIRKSLVYVKLLLAHSVSISASSNNTAKFLAAGSLPTLPLKTSMQKDLISDLFNIYTKFMIKSIEGKSIYNDDSLVDQCLSIQVETIIHPMDELLVNLKQPWIGSSNYNWSKTLQIPVDYLFEEEKGKKLFPLYDIIRLLQFSRSATTKQCIRCGSFTDSQTASSGSGASSATNGSSGTSTGSGSTAQYAKNNCIYMQDVCADKCICGDLKAKMNQELAKQSIKLSMVVAMCSINKGIGLNGTIPWRLPKDLKFFSRVTTYTKDPLKTNAVIMGRLTWNSIPKGLRPLPNRINVVISSAMTNETSNTYETADLSNLIICRSFDEAIETLLRDYSDKLETIFAIGGTQIFKSAFKYPLGFMHRVYLTRVHENIECDVFMEPENFLDDFKKLDQVPDEKLYNVEFNTIETEPANKLTYTFEVYEKVK